MKKVVLKPKLILGLILCLALVFSGGLFGCSTMPGGAVDKSAEGKLFSNREAVCLKSDDASRPWQLKYALTEDTWNEGNLFVTVHERGDVDSMADISKWRPEYTAAIYVIIGDKCKLLKRLKSADGLSCFLKPVVIWASPTGEDRQQIIQITELIYGTGSYKEEHIFTTSSGKELAADLKLDEVELIPASESFKKNLAKGEGVWKGVDSTFTDDGLFFDFDIWKEGDANCCPSAGQIKGAYKLERKPGGKLRIIMDKFKREPIRDSNSS